MALDEGGVELGEMCHRADERPLAIAAAGDGDAHRRREGRATLHARGAHAGPGEVVEDTRAPFVVTDIADDIARDTKGAEAEGEVAGLAGAREQVAGAFDSPAPLGQVLHVAHDEVHVEIARMTQTGHTVVFIGSGRVALAALARGVCSGKWQAA